jgi:hypothetical protein
LERHDHETAG